MAAWNALLIGLLALQPPHAPMSFGTAGPAITYVVLGDSTAAGVGAAYEDGIAVGTARHLGGRFRVTMHNFGVSGAQIEDVAEEQVDQAVRVKPDVVLISAGANDVTHLSSIPSMREDLRDIVTKLRSANPDVRIVVTGAPDMGSPPRIPWILRWLTSLRTRLVNRMVEVETASLGLEWARIAARTGPLFRADRSLFHPDRFHPNARGYATWIAVLNDALDRALDASKRGSPPARARPRTAPSPSVVL